MTQSPPDVEVRTDTHFALLPEWVLNSTVSDKAIRLYCVLRRKADNTTGRSFYSRRSLAAMVGYKDPKSVDRVIAELEEIGALTVQRGRKSAAGDWTTNLYIVRSTPPAGVGAEMPPPSPQDATTVGAENGEDLKASLTEEEPPNPPASLGGRKVRRCIDDSPSRDCEHRHGKRKCTDHAKHDRDCHACHQRPDPPPPPWCGHCDQLGRIDPTLRVVYVDGDRLPCPTCHPAAARTIPPGGQPS